MNSIKLIINSDDFGLSSQVNEAIAMAFNSEWISRASLIVNMPGFEEALKIIRKQNLYNRIGLHLNVSEGIPLTYDIRKLNRFCNKDGKFINYKYKVKDFLKPFTNEEKIALRKEIIAQFETCESKGLTIRHVDSHHHQHIEWQFYNVLLDVLKGKKVVNSLRLAGYSHSTTKNIYRYFINNSIKRKGYKTEERLLNIEETNNKTISNLKLVEVMCHPAMVEGIIMDDNKIEFSSLIKNILQMNRGNCVII